ncbi:MAG: hypothetical protein Q8M07_18090 [Prosthecobacter sp.]|nr:hypothetical protein [Prosthecobacter sp.]HBJ82919.1 hypothetical protein [Verrucomicrobiales bacterium]
MTVTLTEPAESLLRKQVAEGGYPNVDAAVEAAVQTAFGWRATAALESLLDEALTHTGPRVPLSDLRAQQA